MNKHTAEQFFTTQDPRQLVIYNCSGTFEQRPPSGTSLLTFVKRLVLVRTPDLMFFVHTDYNYYAKVVNISCS